MRGYTVKENCIGSAVSEILATHRYIYYFIMKVIVHIYPFIGSKWHSDPCSAESFSVHLYSTKQQGKKQVLYNYARYLLTWLFLSWWFSFKLGQMHPYCL